jgi:16S rRNA (uracil1498-N3)-methyltransferase
MGAFRSDVPALYHSGEFNTGERVRISDDEARHLRALRLRVGDEVVLLNGAGSRATGRLETIDKRYAELIVVSVVLDRGEGVPYIALAAGILSDKSRLEWCIEKGVELGVREFIPLLTERSEGHFYAERAHRIAVAALKQSQRSFLPTLHIPVSLESLIGRFDSFDRVIFCHEEVASEHSLARFLTMSPAVTRTLILIGPEGGFSDAELRMVCDMGAIAVSLGDARLRGETAAIVALVLVSTLSSA